MTDQQQQAGTHMAQDATAQTSTSSGSPSSIDEREVEQFSALSETWWDPTGPFKPLHKFNPTRIEFIRDQVAKHFGRDPLSPKPLEGLRLLDIGCGGGLLSEPMARLGADVTGVDASAKNIGTAALHAGQMGLEIDYRATTAEDLLQTGAQFDAILNMEVVEHVADVGLFMSACAGLLKPGGIMICATLNRTLKSLALAKIGAEYVLGWLPKGTHDWRKFLSPAELAAHLRADGLHLKKVQGVSYSPFKDQWALSTDTDVNYMLVAEKPATN